MDPRKSAGTYASQSLPLIVHLITVSAMPTWVPSHTVDSTKDLHVDFKVVCLYALRCIMIVTPSSTRSPLLKNGRTINTMVGHVDPNVQVALQSVTLPLRLQSKIVNRGQSKYCHFFKLDVIIGMLY